MAGQGIASAVSVPAPTHTPVSNNSVYTRACTNCAKMKAKCVFLDDFVENPSKCRRCSCLDKECIMPTLKRKRQPRRTEEAALTPASAPEQVQVQAQAPARHAQAPTRAPAQAPAPGRVQVPAHVLSPAPIPPPGPPPPPLTTPPLTHPLPCHVLSAVSQANGQEEGAVSHSWHGMSPTHCEDCPPVSATLSALPPAHKNALYQEFLNNMNPYFPFVVLEWRDAATCEQHAPFTLATCLAAALHRHYSMQRTIVLELLQFIGAVMFPGGRKSLDLLYGLNIMTAFFSLHQPTKHQYMNLVHLCKALLIDLGLTTPVYSLPTWTSSIAEKSDIGHGAVLENEQVKLAGIRALLMSWCTSAQMAITGRKLEYPRWNAHLEDCVQTLEAAKASPRDVHSVYVTRIYQTAEKYLAGGAATAISPIRSYVRSFREDLQRLRAAMPASLAANQQVESNLQCVEIALYDAILESSGGGGGGGGGDSQDPAAQGQLLEALHALLARTADFFDVYLDQPTEEFPFYPYLQALQGALAMDVLAKLSFLRVEGWDLAYVRDNYALPRYLGRTMDTFDRVFALERARFPDLETSRFAIYPVRLRQYVKYYEARLAQEAADEANQAANEARGHGRNAQGAANAAESDGESAKSRDKDRHSAASSPPSRGGLGSSNAAGRHRPFIFGDPAWWTHDGTH